MAEVEISFVDFVQFVLSFVIILVISTEVHLDTYLAYSKIVIEGVSNSFGPFGPAQVILVGVDFILNC